MAVVLRLFVLGLLLAGCVCSKRAPDIVDAAQPVEPAAVEVAHPPEASEKIFAKLVPLHRPLPLKTPGDWVSEHPEQPQSFWQYVQAGPVRPSPARGVIYV